MRIEKVTPLTSARLHIVLSDGRSGVFDVQPYMDCEAFVPIREPEQFSKVRNGGYFIEWECGADLSLDTIDAQLLAADDGPANWADGLRDAERT